MVCLQDLTSVHARILSNTTEVLVCNLMKGIYKRAKLLTSPVPPCAQASLQDRIVGYTTTDMINLDYDTILIVLAALAAAAGTQLLSPNIPGLPPPVPPGSPLLAP